MNKVQKTAVFELAPQVSLVRLPEHETMYPGVYNRETLPVISQVRFELFAAVTAKITVFYAIPCLPNCTGFHPRRQ
jgi:hypothetical protein